LIKAIIFDLDDTLISEFDYIKSGYKHIANIISDKINKNKIDIYDDLLRIFQNDSNNVFNQLLNDYEIEYLDEDIMYLVKEYRSHFPSISLYNDVIPCLKGLKNKDFKTGIITDGYSIAQKNKISSVSIEEYFDYIIITDDYGKDFWKPSPDPYRLMKEELSVEFDEMIYIGDNPEKDFHIQTVYPIYTVRIDRPDNIYRKSEYLSNIKEHKRINHLFELYDYIIEIGETKNEGW